MQESKQHGGVRPNAGRPSRHPTLAAALREAFPIERLVKIAEEMVMSPSEDVRTKAWLHIMERAHGKVTDKLELGPAGTFDDARQRAEELSDADLAALVDLDIQRAAILADSRVQNPKVLDGATVLLPAVVAHVLPDSDEE